MFRDTRRSREYFEELLPEFEEGIEGTQQGLDDGDFALPDERVDAAQQLYELAILRCIAHYSNGASREQLAPLVAAILPLRQQLKTEADGLPANQQVYRKPFEQFGGQGKACGSPNLNRYVYALWWLSLLVATGLDQNHREEALALIGNAGKDALLDTLSQRIRKADGPVSGQLLYPELYQPLLDCFRSTPDARPGLIRAFLDGWYDQLQEADWYENHRCELECVYTEYYVGYWSLEAALVVNLLDIDDAGFREHEYYPAGLRI